MYHEYSGSTRTWNACIFVSRGLMVNPPRSPSFISGVTFPTKHVLRSWWNDDVNFLQNELACATVDPVYTPNPCVHILIHVYTWFPVYTTNPCVHNKSMCTHELVCVHKDLMCTHAGPNCWMNQKPKNSNSKIIIIFYIYRSWKKEKRAKKMTECKTEHNNFNFVHTIWIWIFNTIYFYYYFYFYHEQWPFQYHQHCHFFIHAIWKYLARFRLYFTIIIFFIFIMTKNNNGLVGWTKYGNFVRKKRHVFCGSAHNNNHTLEIEDQIKLFIRFLLRKAIKYQDIVGYMKYSTYYCLFPI